MTDSLPRLAAAALLGACLVWRPDPRPPSPLFFPPLPLAPEPWVEISPADACFGPAFTSLWSQGLCLEHTR